MSDAPSHHAAGLEAHGLAVGYRRRGKPAPVLSGLDLALAPGELVGLIGPNGIGKSTLLRTLARLQKPLAGTVRLHGQDVARLRHKDLARQIAVVTTERINVGALPGYRVVALGRYAHQGWSGALGAADHEAVRRAIRAVGAEAIAGRDLGELSDGERQRINIARALAQQPRVLLLDEPTAFLDVASRVELMGLLRRLAREQGLGIVVSTHELELALRTADMLWLIGPDRRLHAGVPEDVVRSGAIDEAFRGERIRFRRDERAFRIVGEGRRRAVVRGSGLDALLAASVLEREGYEIIAEPAPAHALGDILVVDTDPDGGGWAAETAAGRKAGSNFATLAAFVRTGLPPAEAA